MGSENDPTPAEDEVLYSDSSVDVSVAQIPLESYFRREHVISREDRLNFRLTRHLLRLCQYRLSARDESMTEIMNTYKNDLEQEGYSFDELVQHLGDELNSLLVTRGSKNVNTTTRANAHVRKLVLENRRYWKIPPIILEDFLLRSPGPDNSRMNRERYLKICQDIEDLVEELRTE